MWNIFYYFWHLFCGKHFLFYLKGDKENKKEKDDALKNKLCSKIFRFNARGNFYKTIII